MACLDMSIDVQGTLGKGRALTLYGAYHFARRVLPLIGRSVHAALLQVGIAWGALDDDDVLPVLDQDKG